MNRLLRNRLLLQIFFTFAAALCVAALSVILITQAIGSAERVVVGEAHRTIQAALNELKQQYRYRVASDSSWASLPAAARDVSLRGLTQTVLRSYVGIEGGFYVDREFFGYAFPSHDTGSSKTDVPNAERSLIVSANQQSIHDRLPAEHVIRGRADLLVIAALPLPGNEGGVAWAMKRLSGRGVRGAGRREFLIAFLVVAALISIAGTLATGLALARGVAQIKNGLARLEREFDYHLPERADELGSISQSINRMAAVRRRLEAEVLREERLRALGRLTASLAHEIRNPLNSIRLTVQLLERKADAQSLRRDDLKTVRREVDRLNALLSELLDLQRSRQPRVELQAVLPILKHCAELMSHQAEMKGLRLHLEEDGDDIQACFDSHQLIQIVVNVLLNAVEVSPTGGLIAIRMNKDEEIVRVEIEDEGPGLDAEQREHLFEPFFTTKTTGTGLGLAVSRELMRGQGGDLHFLPRPRGACFVVELSRLCQLQHC